MCGECTQMAGLHVPEDLVHLDVYDPGLRSFVRDGECGREVLTTLHPAGFKCTGARVAPIGVSTGG
jgi:phenylacetate-coenzyme A ligase PaaK-like adenylate-forming protein